MIAATEMHMGHADLARAQAAGGGGGNFSAVRQYSSAGGARFPASLQPSLAMPSAAFSASSLALDMVTAALSAPDDPNMWSTEGLDDMAARLEVQVGSLLLTSLGAQQALLHASARAAEATEARALQDRMMPRPRAASALPTVSGGSSSSGYLAGILTPPKQQAAAATRPSFTGLYSPSLISRAPQSLDVQVGSWSTQILAQGGLSGHVPLDIPLSDIYCRRAFVPHGY